MTLQNFLNKYKSFVTEEKLSFFLFSSAKNKEQFILTQLTQIHEGELYSLYCIKIIDISQNFVEFFIDNFCHPAKIDKVHEGNTLSEILFPKKRTKASTVKIDMNRAETKAAIKVVENTEKDRNSLITLQYPWDFTDKYNKY